MFSRLFRRRRPNRVEDNLSSFEVIQGSDIFLNASAPSSGGQRAEQPHHALLRILSRPRPASTNRVASAVQLVEALRQIEGLQVVGVREGNNGAPMHLFVALALRELDYLIDRMSYEELLQAFGDRSPPSQGLAEEVIAAIPSRCVSATEAKLLAIESTACSVCLEQFCANDQMVELPSCCHKYHHHCIETWLKRKPTCPVCRTEVAPGTAPEE